MPTIVPVYAAILTLIYVVLSIRVVRTRQDLKVSLGAGGHSLLERRIRVHGNFAEYVPIALILAAFVEMQGANVWFIHALCLAVLAGRLAHGYGVANGILPPRVLGMVLTFAMLVIASGALLSTAIVHAMAR